MGATSSVTTLVPLVYETKRAAGCKCCFEDFRLKDLAELCPVCVKLGSTVLKASHPRMSYNEYGERCSPDAIIEEPNE